jgi:hypothetical protein
MNNEVSSLKFLSYTYNFKNFDKIVVKPAVFKGEMSKKSEKVFRPKQPQLKLMETLNPYRRWSVSKSYKKYPKMINFDSFYNFSVVAKRGQG